MLRIFRAGDSHDLFLSILPSLHRDALNTLRGKLSSKYASAIEEAKQSEHDARRLSLEESERLLVITWLACECSDDGAMLEVWIDDNSQE